MDSTSKDNDIEWCFEILAFSTHDEGRHSILSAKLVGADREVTATQLDCTLETGNKKLKSVTAKFDGWMGAIPDEEGIFDLTVFPGMPDEYKVLIESGLYLRGRASLNKDCEQPKQIAPDLEKAAIIIRWFESIASKQIDD